MSAVTSRNGITLVQARVCVRRLPPDPQGDKTRISRDPWSITAGEQSVQPLERSGGRGAFPAEDTYHVGACASGYLPFEINGTADTVRYANGVGDRAVWDVDDLEASPVIPRPTESQPSNDGIGEGTFIVGEDISPGRYRAEAQPGGVCYWARLRDDSGDFESIIANNATDGSASVTIRSSDGAFETSGCTRWLSR